MRDLILGLARPLLRLLGRDDRGAVAVLVGVLIGGGVLLGMGALVLDVGTLYQERAELQNGADAAALAVAGSCANGVCTPAAVSPLATGIADKNASRLTGHLEKVDLICGPALGVPCPASDSASITNCPPNPVNLPTGVSYADVHTSTLMPNGSTLLPPILARTLLGNGSYKGTDVGACAQAEWGPAGSADTLALTISLCAWQNLTGTDNDGDATSAGDTDNDQDDSGAFYTPTTVYIKGKAKSCAGPGGLNVAGGFDWLSTDTDSVNGKGDDYNSDTDNDGDASATCTAYIDLTTKSTYNNTGNNVSQACRTALENDVANQTKVFLPVFDSTSGTGKYATYHVVGLAGFIIQGYANMPFSPQNDGYDGSYKNYSLCLQGSGSGSNAPCIQGEFTPGLIPLASINTKFPDYGAIAVQLTG